MGGKSSSSNASTNNSVNTSNSAAVQGDGNITLTGVDGGINYTATDHGAVEMAGELASESVGLAGHSVDSALSFGSDVFSGAFDSLTAMAGNQSALASQSLDFANSVNASLATQGASDLNSQNTKVLLGVGALIALVLLVVLFKK